MRAFRELLRRGLVGGRSAANCGGDVKILQLEPIVAVGGMRLAGESGFIQYREHELAGSLAGEVAARAVGGVRPRSQSQDQHPRLGIAEAGHGLAPILALAVSPALLAGN